MPPPHRRRLLLLAIFVGLLVLFRHLLVLMVFFVAFERPLALGSRWLAARSGLSRRWSLLAVLIGFLSLLGGAIALGVGRAIRGAIVMRSTLPERLASLRQTDLYARIEEHVHEGGQRLVEGAQHYAGHALGYLAEAGHVLLFALIGFLLAVIFVLEHEELEGFAHGIDPHSAQGTLLRWLGHLADAISVTLQFQLVVAACNALFTLPVLLLVGIPHAGTFLFMIFFSGMVPVVGNFVAGAILTLLAYQARGWLGVGIFTLLTFVLHKLESFYLNPRLASRHVHLPGFVLIVSLLMWEHLLGFAGLFVSFPFLFVATRIRNEFRAERAALPAT